ncbi:MAG: ATP-binding protein [Chitinophagales bacterium]|nr:ATP-binding protein [Chitinophagales bacterium]
MLIIVAGLPGSGKSFFAYRFAERINAEYLSSDVIRRELLSEREYSQEEKYRVYDEMLYRTQQLLSKNRDVIVDATFYKNDLRQKYLDAAISLKCKTIMIEVWASESISRKRLERNRKYSEADLEVYLKVKKSFESIQQDHLRLRSTNSNIDHMIETSLAYIKDKYVTGASS